MRVRVYDDEPFLAYVARLAAKRCSGQIDSFLAELPCPVELSRRDLRRGHAQAALARVLDLPADVYAAVTFERQADGSLRLGQRRALPAALLSFQRVRSCRRCLEGDDARGDDRHLRSWWFLPDVSVCPHHQFVLDEAPLYFDAAHIWCHGVLDDEETEHRDRPAPEALALSRFIVGHLFDATLIDPYPLLANMAFQDIYDGLEHLGTFDLRGPCADGVVAPHEHTGRIARQRGLALIAACRTPAGLEAHISSCLAERAEVVRGVSLQAVLGHRFHRWAIHRRAGLGSDLVNPILNACLAHCLTKPGALILRQDDRTKWTIDECAAELETDVAPLLAVLARLGCDTAALRSPQGFILDKIWMNRLRVTWSRFTDTNGLARIAGLTSTDLRSLETFGVLRPWVSAAARKPALYYRPDFLQLLLRLRKNVPRLTSVGRHQSRLLKSHGVGVRLADFMNGKAQIAGCLKDGAHLRDFVVDIRPYTPELSEGRFSHGQNLALILNCDYPAALHLMGTVLPPEIRLNKPKRGKDGYLFLLADVRRFQECYISLDEIDRRSEKDRVSLIAQLDALPLQIMARNDTLGLRYYDRASAEAALELVG